VTIDAMGCQKEISEKIRTKNADYIFSLKGNHSNLHDDVRLYFESLHQKKLKTEMFHSYQIEKDHGRIEERDCWSVNLPKGLHSDGWKDLASIVMVRAKQTNTEKPSEEDRYFITSLKAQNVKWDGDRVNRWTRHGSTRYLWKEAEVEATIQYVVNEQGLPMAVFENKNRTFNTAI